MAGRTGKRGPNRGPKASVAPASKAAQPANTPVTALAETHERKASVAPAKAATVIENTATEQPAAMPALPAEIEVAAPIVEAAQAAVTPAAVLAANIMQKEEATMATQFDAPKFEAPKMLADMNDRTKAAMEKSSKMFEEMNELAKGNVDAMVESGKIAARGFETLGQDAAEYGRRSFEGLTATMKTLASVKSPTEFFKVQSEYVRGAFDAAVAQSSKNTEAMMKLAGDAAQPISSRFAVAAEKVKAAA